VAYLTIAAFLFLALVLAVVTWKDSLHMGADAEGGPILPGSPTSNSMPGILKLFDLGGIA
jgi:hypothetical protein